MTVPDYIADPVTVTIAPPAVASVSLFMHRNGRASVGVDWEGDAGAADAGHDGGAAPVSLVVSTMALNVNEGGSATFTVRLSGDPGASVAVTVASANTTKVTAGPATLTFTSANFATPQAVTLTALQDTDLVNDVVAVTLMAPAPVTPATATVTVTDVDDDIQALQLNVTSPLVMNESPSAPPAVTATFGARLAFQPATSISATVASSNTAKLTVSPTTLTFTPANFSTFQNVTLTSVHDTDTTNDTVTITFTGVPPAPLTVNITDTGP
jgi:cellulose 1,4-beta-cellobiosidase